MTVAPPFEAGGVHETTELRFWYGVATTAVGALGTVATRVDAEGLEATEVPDTLVAVTEKA